MYIPFYAITITKRNLISDKSNPIIGVLLYSILSEPRLQKVKIIIILTKMDFSYRQMRNEALLMMQMRELEKQVSQKITIVQASAISNEGVDEIFDWLMK